MRGLETSDERAGDGVEGFGGGWHRAGGDGLFDLWRRRRRHERVPRARPLRLRTRLGGFRLVLTRGGSGVGFRVSAVPPAGVGVGVHALRVAGIERRVRDVGRLERGCASRSRAGRERVRRGRLHRRARRLDAPRTEAHGDDAAAVRGGRSRARRRVPRRDEVRNVTGVGHRGWEGC